MSATATQGPWSIGSVDENATEILALSNGQLCAIAAVWADDIEDTAANAHLIAAAPRLLAACDRFVSYADKWPDDISGPLRDDFLPMLRDAIAAARGEA